MQILPRGKVYVQKEGDLCHIAGRWHGQREKDLYVTLCGKVVSTRTSSPRTTNVGYHVHKEGSCNCTKCRIYLGQKILLTSSDRPKQPHSA